MKSKFIRSAAAMLSGILILTGATARAGAANEVRFNGEGSARIWEYDGVTMYGDINDYFGTATKELLPGSVAEVTVQLRNTTGNPVTFTLKATALTEGADLTAEQAAAWAAASAAYPDKTQIDALLEQIDIEVTHGGALIYKGTLGGAAGIGGGSGAIAGTLYGAGGVTLGRVSAGWLGNVTVKLTVRDDLDIEFADAMCAVDWVFAAAQENDPVIVNPGDPDPSAAPPASQPPASGEPDATPAPDAPPVDPSDPSDPGDPGDTDFTDNEPPLAGLDDAPLTDFDDDKMPLDAIPDIVVVPKTGDDGGVMTYATVAGAALVVMAALLVTIPRKRKKS